MRKIILFTIIGLILGAIAMDYWNYKLAKAGGLTKRGGIFENIPSNA